MASQNDALAPPDDLPGDEHDVWRRFAALGAVDQFRLPDAQRNARLRAGVYSPVPMCERGEIAAPIARRGV